MQACINCYSPEGVRVVWDCVINYLVDYAILGLRKIFNGRCKRYNSDTEVQHSLGAILIYNVEDVTCLCHGACVQDNLWGRD